MSPFIQFFCENCKKQNDSYRPLDNWAALTTTDHLCGDEILEGSDKISNKCSCKKIAGWQLKSFEPRLRHDA